MKLTIFTNAQRSLKKIKLAEFLPPINFILELKSNLYITMPLTKPEQKSSSLIDFMAPFAIGGISGALATCLIQPIDTFKVQIQVTS